MIQLPKERPPLKQISEVVWEISPDYKKDEPKIFKLQIMMYLCHGN
ncbi:MAG TPA: hypothetical protein HA224_03335 [Nanoarchaeota archaeon]|nr:hypothetical protein [Nanoarchaeota archaeon]